MAFKHDDLRERVLDIAEARLAEGGAGELRARALAVAAGVSVGTIYNLFGSMSGLMEALFARALERFHSAASVAVGRASDADRRAALLSLADAYLGFVEGNGALWRSLLARERLEADRAPGRDAQGPLFELVGNVLRGSASRSSGPSTRWPRACGPSP